MCAIIIDAFLPALFYDDVSLNSVNRVLKKMKDEYRKTNVSYFFKHAKVDSC